jgi:hypothetical protein
MKTLAIACALVAAAVPAGGQPKITNATVQERPAGNLARTFQELSGQAGPLWVGYTVPSPGRDGHSCDCDRIVELEGPGRVAILYRVDEKQVTKVRPVSDSCDLDGGGRTVYWLTGANPAASVALLKTLVDVKGALVAIAMHDAPEAVTALVDLARNGTTSSVRSDALFWVAQRAGRKAAGTITDAIDNDPDTKVKERAVFALSQLPKEEGVPRLIEVARQNRNPRVRRQAVFWLGQSKDPRALKFFEEILGK